MKEFKYVQKQIRQRINQFFILVSGSCIKPFSRFFRRVFEVKNIQQILGILLVATVFGLAILPNSLSGLQTIIDTNFSQVAKKELEIKTEKSIRLPVENFRITQGYHFFHPGLDLAAFKGVPVYPIMEGRVEKVGKDRWAFGNHVIVDHGSGFKTIYAHLAKIETKEGENVTKDSILGLIGSTGWSTGPHLHLQIWQENHWVNPRTFFEGYFGQRLASTR